MSENYWVPIQAARAEREARGTAVVTALAQVGISATYEDRQAQLVSMSLEDAEALVALLARDDSPSSTAST